MIPLPRDKGSAALRAPVLAALWIAGLPFAQDPADEEAATPVPVGPVLELTLEDAVRLALEQNVDLDTEALNTKIARFDALGSWGSFDPVLRATGTGSESEQQGTSQLAGGEVIENDSLEFTSGLFVPFTTGGSIDLSLFHSNDSTTNSFSLFDTSTTDVITLSVTQPLLRGAWERYATNTQRQRELELNQQVERERGVRQRVILDVVQAYWDLVASIDNLALRELAVERARQQEGQDERRLELGAGTEVDVLQSVTNVAQQEEQLVNARFLLRQAEDNLRRLLFQTPTGEIREFLDDWDVPIVPLTDLPEVEAVELDWRRSLETAIENRSEIRVQRLAIDAAEVALAAARSGELPQLDLLLSSSSAGFDPDPDEARDTAVDWEFPNNSASLEFSIPLRNRSAHYARRAARANVRANRLALQRQSLDVLADVRNAIRDLTYRAEALLAAEKSAALAQRQLEAEQVRMDIGLSTTFQVLEFQETLAEANATAVRARADYAKARVGLLFSEGVLEVDATFP